MSMNSTSVLTESIKERWRTASRFADVLEAEVKSRRNPLISRVVSWLNLCRICQDLEEEILMAQKPLAEDKQLHCVLLSSVIASGEGLLPECAEGGAASAWAHASGARGQA